MSMFGEMRRQLTNMLARGTLALVDSSKRTQRLQMNLLADEQKGDVEHIEPYGLTANAPPGAEVVAVFFDGDRSHGVTIVVGDKRYRLKNLASGEVALYTMFDGQVGGHHIIFKADQSIEVRAKNINVKADQTLRLEGDIVRVHAHTQYGFDCNGQGQNWNGSKVDTWQINDTAGTPHNHAPPEIP